MRKIFVAFYSWWIEIFGFHCKWCISIPTRYMRPAVAIQTICGYHRRWWIRSESPQRLPFTSSNTSLLFNLNNLSVNILGPASNSNSHMNQIRCKLLQSFVPTHIITYSYYHLLISSSVTHIIYSYHPLISSSTHIIIRYTYHLLISSSTHIIYSYHHLLISSSTHIIIYSYHHLLISSSIHIIIYSYHHLLTAFETGPKLWNSRIRAITLDTKQVECKYQIHWFHTWLRTIFCYIKHKIME